MSDWTKGMLIEILLMIFVVLVVAFLTVFFVVLMMYRAAIRLWGSIREHIGD